MHNWFECKISYEKIMENGMQKKVTEPYLVDALSFTEAEARITEEIRPYVSGEFTIADIKRAKFSEIFFNENGDRFFKAKVYFITLEEKSGAEKKTAVQMLAQASTIREALEVVEKGMAGTLSDYQIANLTETEIMDIFPYAADDGKTVTVVFEEVNEAVIDKKQLEEDLLDINFGSLLVQFERRDIGLIAVNAVDPGGFNHRESVFGKLLKYKRN